MACWRGRGLREYSRRQKVLARRHGNHRSIDPDGRARRRRRRDGAVRWNNKGAQARDQGHRPRRPARGAASMAYVAAMACWWGRSAWRRTSRTARNFLRQREPVAWPSSRGASGRWREGQPRPGPAAWPRPGVARVPVRQAPAKSHKGTKRPSNAASRNRQSQFRVKEIK